MIENLSLFQRIPGLSDRFLYFNDDFMLGQEIWPEDFFTDHEGFKVNAAGFFYF